MEFTYINIAIRICPAFYDIFDDFEDIRTKDIEPAVAPVPDRSAAQVPIACLVGDVNYISISIHI